MALTLFNENLKMLRHKLGIAALSVAVALSVSTETLAKAAYMVPTGATNCAACHVDNYGNGYKPGMLEAAASPWGKFVGLIAWLNASANDTKPVLLPLNTEWDAMVGEELVIPLRYSDAEDDSFSLLGKVPVGMKPVFPIAVDAQTHLALAGVIWTPTADQANKTFTINVAAKELGAGRSLISDAPNITAVKVRVWPARTSATKDVSHFMVRRAQWNNHQLLLEGKVLFQSSVTLAQRKTALANLTMNIKTESGVVIGSPLKLTTGLNGNWTQTLSLLDTQVPCVVQLDYEGIIATRTVKITPATCVK
jgi:hypothetical protein